MQEQDFIDTNHPATIKYSMSSIKDFSITIAYFLFIHPFPVKHSEFREQIIASTVGWQYGTDIKRACDPIAKTAVHL